MIYSHLRKLKSGLHNYFSQSDLSRSGIKYWLPTEVNALQYPTNKIYWSDEYFWLLPRNYIPHYRVMWILHWFASRIDWSRVNNFLLNLSLVNPIVVVASMLCSVIFAKLYYWKISDALINDIITVTYIGWRRESRTARKLLTILSVRVANALKSIWIKWRVQRMEI